MLTFADVEIGQTVKHSRYNGTTMDGAVVSYSFRQGGVPQLLINNRYPDGSFNREPIYIDMADVVSVS